MTINIPAAKLARFIQNNCQASLPALRELQLKIDKKRIEAAESHQAFGNFSVDIVEVALALGVALASLEMINDLADGLTEVEEAKLPNQPTQ